MIYYNYNNYISKIINLKLIKYLCIFFYLRLLFLCEFEGLGGIIYREREARGGGNLG